MFIAIIIFIYSTFPGRGGYEGGQREILLLKDRNDNWGFIVPLVYGNWPNLFNHWRFTLVLLQLTLFWIGSYLILKNAKFSNFISKFIVATILLVGSVFASQLWRDSSLFSLITLGIGLEFYLLRIKRKILHYSVLITSISILIFGSMFKPIFAPIIALFFLFPILIEKPILRMSTKYYKSLIVLIIILISVLPISLDKYFRNASGMVKVFPEQQPMIYDLAAIYCWGVSPNVRLEVATSLKMIAREDMPLRALCSSLELSGWDNLHMPGDQWIYSAPLTRISQENEKIFHELQNKWLSVIFHHPNEYLIAKLPFISQVLTMSNSFTKPAIIIELKPNLFNQTKNTFWSWVYWFSNFMDKCRFFTLGFILFLTQMIVMVRLKKSHLTWRRWSSANSALILLVTISLFTVVLETVAYTSGNGRYVMPYVLLIYLLGIVELTKSRSNFSK